MPRPISSRAASASSAASAINRWLSSALCRAAISLSRRHSAIKSRASLSASSTVAGSRAVSRRFVRPARTVPVCATQSDPLSDSLLRSAPREAAGAFGIPETVAIGVCDVLPKTRIGSVDGDVLPRHFPQVARSPRQLIKAPSFRFGVKATLPRQTPRVPR